MNDSKYKPFSEQLMDEARRQRDLLALEAKREKLYAEHIAALDEQIKALKAETDAMKAAMVTYVRETGDLSALPERVTFVQSRDWTWDDDKMLVAVKAHKPDLVRVKESLKRTDVKKMLEGGVPEWAQEADPVKADNSYVKVEKLGDLLLAEAKAAPEQEAKAEAVGQGEPEKEQAVA